MSEAGDLSGVFGRFASGVTVVTCRTPDGEVHGATVAAFTPVSWTPRLCQVTVTRGSKAADFLRGNAFAVNMLAGHQTDLAMHFAGRPNSTPIAWVADPDAVAPAIADTAACVSCIPWAEYDGGDHVIVIGQVVAATLTDLAPLVYHRGNFHELGRRTADAHWGGSSDDPMAGWFSSATAPVRIADLTHRQR